MDRFWAKVNKTDECWVWQGAKHQFGYGLAWNGRRNVRAHRLAYEEAFGPIPPGLNVCHACDNPPCVRPDHLFVGTHAENVADKIAKGRGFSPFTGQVQVGSLNRASKLTEATVIEARARYAAGERVPDIAASLNVNPATVYYAATGKTWTHVPMPDISQRKRPRWTWSAERRAKSRKAA